MISRLLPSRQNFSGWLALTAVFVLLIGKSVHLGQECSGSCCASEVEVPTESFSCSCCHHAHDSSEEDSENESNEHHDEHQCPVCSVLSHVTECPLIVGVPVESRLVCVVACDVVSVATDGPQLLPSPRGPPVTA